MNQENESSKSVRVERDCVDELGEAEKEEEAISTYENYKSQEQDDSS